MRTTSRAQESEEEFLDLTPMLDVVFIMLIFFIVTAVFVRDPGVDVNRPAATTAIDMRNLAVLVAVDKNNVIWIDQRQISLADVRGTVERLRTQNLKGPVVIQADAKAKTGITAAVMEEVRLAGAPLVSLATLPD